MFGSILNTPLECKVYQSFSTTFALSDKRKLRKITFFSILINVNFITFSYIEATGPEEDRNFITLLGKGNLIFCCAGPTDPIFWKIKIIILISHIFFFLLFIFLLFLLACNKVDKKQKLVHLTWLNHSIERCGRFLKHKFLYLDDQYFCFSIC